MEGGQKTLAYSLWCEGGKSRFFKKEKKKRRPRELTAPDATTTGEKEDSTMNLARSIASLLEAAPDASSPPFFLCAFTPKQKR